MWPLVIYGMLTCASPSTIGKNKDCYRLSFVNGSVKHIVDYHLNGKWRNTIRIYNESDLPADLRQTIKIAFPDSEIITITELKYVNSLTHFIKIRQNGWTKTIQVTDDNIAIVEEFKEL